MVDRTFTAMKAFIVHDSKILLLRESTKYEDGANHGRYDVVGGRVKPGQHFKESLLREIQEETGLNVEIGRPFFVNEWRPRVGDEEWQIIGTFFECKAESSHVVLSEDHDDYKWISLEEVENLTIIPNLREAFASYREWKLGN